MSLAQALAISDNIYAVKTLEKIGYEHYRDMLKRFDLNYTDADNPSIALGTIETSLYDLTNAYNMIAANGQKEKQQRFYPLKMHLVKQYTNTKKLNQNKLFLKRMHSY